MSEFLARLFDFLEAIAPSITAVLAVWLGWWLGRRSYIRQLSVEHVQRKFGAFREIKSVLDLFPQDLTRDQLLEKMNSDAAFRNRVSERLVRLFGLRNELVPYLEAELVTLIDSKLRPLYYIEGGTFTFKDGECGNLVDIAQKMIGTLRSLEKNLTEKYESYLR